MGFIEKILENFSADELRVLEKHSFTGNQSQPELLFSLLQKYKDDEEKIANRFKKEWPRGNISVVRTQLGQLLLEGVYRLYSKNDVQSEVNELLFQIRFFSRKSAFDIAVKLLDRAMDLAQNKELLSQHLELLELQLGFYQTRILSDEQGKQQTEAALRRVLAQQQNRLEYRLLVFRQMELLNQSYMLRSPEGQAQFEAIFNHPLMADESEALTIEAKVDFYMVRGQYFSISNQFVKAAESLERLVTLLDAHPHIKKARGLTYFSTYSQIATYGYILKDRALMERAIAAIENSEKHTEMDQIGAATMLVNSKLAYYDLIKNKEGLLQTVLESFDLLRKHAIKIKHDVRSTLLLSAISSFVELGEYEMVLKMMQEFGPFIFNGERVDIKVYFFFYELIAQIETGNELVVNDTLQNFNRFMLRNEFKSKFEKVMVQFLRIVSSARPDVKKEMTVLLEQLHALKDASLLDQNRVMFDILSNMISSRIAGVRFHEYLQQQQ